MTCCLIKESGQAMTEFVVSVGFIFLGLFVIVPMFGKLMDIQYLNQQASRYVAWERTVWFDPLEAEKNGRVVSGNYWESVATRTDKDITNTMENRFFYAAGPKILSPFSELDADVVTENLHPLWNYVQSKKTMYGGTTIGSDSIPNSMENEAQTTPGVGYKIIGTIEGALQPFRDELSGFIGDMAGFLSVGHETKNFYSPVVTTQLIKENSHGGGDGVWDRVNGNWGKGIEDAIFSSGWDGTLKSRSAILADGWNTQSLKHYQDSADNFVPSTLFDNAIFDAAKTIASVLEGGPSNSAIDRLEFGAVGIEPMPAADGGGPMGISEDGPHGGFYYYDD